MISVGIIGGTGYTGKYLIDYCNQHQFITEFNIYAKSSAGQNLLSIFPEMEGIVNDQLVNSVDQLSYEHDLYFVSLPHGESLNYIPEIINKGKKVIDLGGDFRLNDVNLYSEWYGYQHYFGQLLKNKNYGLADFNKSKMYKQKLVANPGCYPTAVLLSTLPLVEAMSADIRTVSTVAYSGTSGAGKSAKTALLLSEMDGNAKAYNINKHRHEPEILQELNSAGFNSSFSFTTHLLPISKGIYSTTAIHMNSAVNEAGIIEGYKNHYTNSSFVRLRDSAPELKWVVGTNFCDINVAAKDKTIIVTCAIDNLIKGASGQAIQNMNLMFGWNETEGIINKSLVNYSNAVGGN